MQNPADLPGFPMQEAPSVFPNTHLLSGPPMPSLQMPPDILMSHCLKMSQGPPLTYRSPNASRFTHVPQMHPMSPYSGSPSPSKVTNLLKAPIKERVYLLHQGTKV